MEDLLSEMPDEKERYRMVKKINYHILKLNMMGRKSPFLEESEIYYSKVAEKIGTSKNATRP